MTDKLLAILTAQDPALRDRSLDEICAALSTRELLEECDSLESFRRSCDNLYQRVRALFFLYAVHRFHLPLRSEVRQAGRIHYEGFGHLLERRFDAAIDTFLAEQEREGPCAAISSALAVTYRALGFQTLVRQVRQSVRGLEGNRWMFAVAAPEEQPLRLRPELLGDPDTVLREATPVRMDLSHSGWSDIFFLAMDYPEGARVLNVSIDLGVRGRDAVPRPPVEAYLRVLDVPELRLVSIDLNAEARMGDLAEVFDFGKDYLGLLKAAVIASGLVPPSLEGTGSDLSTLVQRVAGPGRGIEITSRVRGIPRGSRLAVSTSLLASLITLCMRATGQTQSLTGPLEEDERRLVVARAILGEWLAGSGGGWQDSGGLWPGFKLIEGALAREGDAEHGISRGRLLPDHRVFGTAELPEAARQALQDSLVLVHGGMAQDVGPVLEMVTERYLLRSPAEWQGRQLARRIFDGLLGDLRRGDIRAVGRGTTRNFTEPIQTIIPWATNRFTETLIERVRADFGQDFWGFWMLGGMSGGGMGFLFRPERRAEAQDALGEILLATKRALSSALPFAMDPVVYDFAINDRGSCGARVGAAALAQAREEEAHRRAAPREAPAEAEDDLDRLLDVNGFDARRHEQVRVRLASGEIGLARNRLPATTRILDAEPADLIDTTRENAAAHRERGLAALAAGQAAVVTLAAGSGSRWTRGAGVVKALHPVCRIGGKQRSFLEIQLAKTRRSARLAKTPLPHVVTVSHLTQEAIESFLAARPRGDGAILVRTSPGRSIGLRLVPTERDLRFAWHEQAQQQLAAEAQKVRESLQEALIGWARDTGEASDYRDNLPSQCIHPVGHAYELPNLLLNGTLAALIEERPQLTTLLLQNVDTLGADLDPSLLGLFLSRPAPLAFEVLARHVEDRGGGLARVDGRLRLVESLALPREEEELELTWYNSMTTWIDVDGLLDLFGLTRAALGESERVTEACRRFTDQLPTYVTLKDVKKRWGHAQEDIFPVAQFEKLWGDVTALDAARCDFFAVPRTRGQQLKEPAQLDGWLRDGSMAVVEALCTWEASP